MSIKKISKIQPESFEFSKDNLLEAENEIKKYPKNSEIKRCCKISNNCCRNRSPRVNCNPV